jgi:hypothetical protein
MPTLTCPIRKVQVAPLPEEQVRVHLLNHMIQNLGFPPSAIVVEKGLSQMPHLELNGLRIPKRRADIVCFAGGVHTTSDYHPLLLIECKAVKLTPKMLNQVVGYNHFMKACFIALVNQDEIRTGWFDKAQGKYVFVPYLPSYKDLREAIPLPEK